MTSIHAAPRRRHLGVGIVLAAMGGLPVLAFGSAGSVVAQSVEAVRSPVAIVDAGTCRRLVRHQPDPDVTFRPGVDARGRAVVPADLHDYSAFAEMVPDTVTFHVVLDPFETGAVTPPPGIESPGMVLGTVGYDINRGTFTLNGRPITTGEQDVLVRACRAGLSGQAPPE